MFWLDEIIEDILKKYKKDSFLITDWFTPSGKAHIGSLRGVVIHDLIRQGLIEKGKKAIFQYGFDDMDPMDGFPNYLASSFKKYLGLPLFKIPSPDRKSKSFSEQYSQEFEKVFNYLGIKTKIVKTSKLYISGKFDKAIKIVLDNASKIREIYKKVSGSNKGENWYPIQVICSKCGKIGTTNATNWDGKMVEFECVENLVSWARGCGYKGKISPFSGNSKLPWKVEWPSKWFIFQNDIEGEGKDHFVAGGSRDIANEIYKQVFKKNSPYDIRYEHFLVGGAKMSTSKGLGTYAEDMMKFLPPNIFKFLFVRARPQKTIDFRPTGETIPNLYDEYDRAALSFQKNPKALLSRAYYFSEIHRESEQPKYFLRFSKIAYMLQMPRIDIFEYAKKEKGDELSTIEKKEIETRLNVAKAWLKKFAPANYKFEIQEELPKRAKDLSVKQKEFLREILRLVYSKEWVGEDLHKEIHEIKKRLQIDPREAFSAIYLTFIGKDSGPQAGWFLASLARDFVIKRLKEVI